MKHTEPIAKAFIYKVLANAVNARVSKAHVDDEFGRELFELTLRAVFAAIERFGYLRLNDGWGVFEVKEYPPHLRVLKGNPLSVPLIKKVRFKMGKMLRDMLNGTVSVKPISDAEALELKAKKEI